jgi:hypothetical protein
MLCSVISRAQCPATIADLIAGGSYTGPCTFNSVGAIVITGTLNYSGDLTLTGVTTVTLASNVTYAGGIFAIQGAAGNLTVGDGTTGSLTIQSGTLQVDDGASGQITVANNATMTLNPGSSATTYLGPVVSAGGTINNSGTLTNGSGNLVIGGTLNNFSGGSVNSVANFSISTGAVVNASAGSTISSGGTTFVNGTLNLDGNVSASSAFTVTSTGVLATSSTSSVTALTFTVNASASATTAGTITSTNAITINGTLTNTGSITSTTSSINIGGTTTNSNIMNAATTIAVAGTGNLTIDTGGSMNGTLLSVLANGILTVNATGQITTTATGDNNISGTVTTNGILNLGGDLVIDGAAASFLMQSGTITINRSAGDGDLEVTNSGTFTMDGGTLNIQDDITTYVNGLTVPTTPGVIVINGTVTVSDDVDIAAGGSFTSTSSTTVLTLGDGYVDAACPYSDGTYHFCACLGNPPDGDGVSAACAAALPVELEDFYGTQNGSSIELSWVTATETNNDFFTIEKLRPSDTFEEVARVPGAGTTLHRQEYSAIDPNPTIGKNYYRLKQTDNDLKTSHSELIKVVFESNTFIVQVYPNPVVEKNVTIFVQGMQANEAITFELKSMVGQTTLSGIAQANATGSAALTLPLPTVPVGVYIINVNGKSQKIFIK